MPPYPSLPRSFLCAEIAAAASVAASNASEAMAAMTTLQYTNHPRPEEHKTEHAAGDDGLAHTKKTSHGVANPGPAAVVRHRKTGRVMVKQEAAGAVVKEEATAPVAKEEPTALVVKEEPTAPPVEGAGFARDSQDNASIGNPVKRERRRRVGGTRGPKPSIPQTVKLEKQIAKKSPKKADGKIKVRAEAEKKQRGRENSSQKKIPPRLAEKAALILSVMDALYPDPPIPINHLVRGERRGVESRPFCLPQGVRTPGLFVFCMRSCMWQSFFRTRFCRRFVLGPPIIARVFVLLGECSTGAV